MKKITKLTNKKPVYPSKETPKEIIFKTDFGNVSFIDYGEGYVYFNKGYQEWNLLPEKTKQLILKNI